MSFYAQNIISIMTDVHSKAVRSHNMSRIKGKNTKPELLVRKFLFSKGFRFRIHSIHLPGKPDIVLPKYKTIILVNGCFWHGHNGCKKFKFPSDNSLFWKDKILKTKIRDEIQVNNLVDAGWKVFIIWECEVKTDHSGRLEEIISEIRKK